MGLTKENLARNNKEEPLRKNKVWVVKGPDLNLEETGSVQCWTIWQSWSIMAERGRIRTLDGWYGYFKIELAKLHWMVALLVRRSEMWPVGGRHGDGQSSEAMCNQATTVSAWMVVRVVTRKKHQWSLHKILLSNMNVSKWGSGWDHVRRCVENTTIVKLWYLKRLNGGVGLGVELEHQPLTEVFSSNDVIGHQR